MVLHSLRSRIFCGMGLVAVVCTVAMVLGVGPLIQDFAARSLVDRLEAARRSFDNYLASQYRMLNSMAGSAAANPALTTTLDIVALDPETANHAALEIRERLGVDLIVLTDPLGKVFGSSMPHPPTGNSIADTPMIRQSIGRGGYSGLYDDGHAMYLVASAPVTIGGRMVGILIIGSAIGLELMDDFSESLDIDVMVMRAGKAVAWSTGMKQFDPRAFARSLTGSETTKGDVHRVQVGTMDRFAVLASVHPSVRVVLSKSSDELAELERYLWNWVFGFGVLAAAAAMLVSHWIAHRIAIPIRKLVEVADRMASGKLDTVADESSMDETARLGRALNQMTRHLRQLVDDARARAEMLQKQRNELEWANRAKNDFLINASHELRTPIANIVSSSEILNLYDGEIDEETRSEFLRTIDVEAERISALIGQFLDVSRMESGSTQLKYEEFDFAAAVRGLVELFRGRSGNNRPISFKSHDQGRCIGDRRRLLQVVEQLLDNVLKFTPDGSVVTIDMWQRDETFELRVADHGRGLESDEERERIFERFVQGGDILTEKPSGVGLGLALARDVARAHAGDLGCVPNPEGGSVFVLTIPTRTASGTQDSAPVTSPSSDPLTAGEVPGFDPIDSLELPPVLRQPDGEIR